MYLTCETHQKTYVVGDDVKACPECSAARVPEEGPTLRMDSDHRYWHGSRPLISVTQVLSEAGLTDARWFTEEARARGTAVHQTIALHQRFHRIIVSSSLEVEGVPSGHFDAYLRFVDETDAIAEQTERQVCDLTLGYAGTFDAFGTLLGRRAVWDYKTGTTPKTAGIQLAAYRRCLPEPHTIRRYSVELRADGTYRLQEWVDRKDEQTFLAALQVAMWKRVNL